MCAVQAAVEDAEEALEQAQSEQKLLEAEILDKGKWIDEKDARIEPLEAFVQKCARVQNHEGWQGEYFLEARSLLAGDTRLEQIDREGEELQTMPLPTSPYPPDSKRRTWWCPMCHEKSDDDGIVRNHKKTCCHYGSALAPPAVACATQTDGDNGSG